ncbi:cell wall metabolism sensor histidine kinase WalK [Adlercreutzia sp. ZJ154]|uniref:sensor histidine kinase n=1 Tax=Adlercreutzia sp. ZJ154 TaxID=2709790 RepID=UPI0013EB6F26|nr:HAMP domain-containing sensor histidine kinase [Adlercreutzia sp. ZJ154]
MDSETTTDQNTPEAAPAADEKRPSNSEENFASEDAEETKRKRSFFSRLRWANLTYVTRIALSFAMIAALTAIISVCVVSAVWGQYFQAYTAENIESLASTAATRIALVYENSGELDSEAVETIAMAAEVSPEVSIKVLDAAGNTIYETSNESAPRGDGTSFEPSDPAQIAGAKIKVGDKVVGSVRMWVYGSDTLMNKLDRQFRDNSYAALIFAGLAAVAIASLFGMVFARRLVAPINRLTRTAAAVKAGKLNARSNLTGEDEIAHLGETFDAMIASVENDRKLEQRLTSDVAHELRTPLMSIQANMEAMIDGVYDTDEEHLERVNSEVQRLSRLVDALLKLSRLENRSNPMKQDVVNLGELIGEVVQTHEQFVTESGLKLTFYTDDRVLVLGDSDMIRQAVVNLISNAVRYTPEGGRIDVSVRRSTAMANIAVSDTGIGLSPEEAKMVFGRFWRADAGRARASGGLGIGLAVVKEIVDRHKGWIGVEGETGKGATFTIHIPLYEDTISRVRARSNLQRNRISDRRQS